VADTSPAAPSLLPTHPLTLNVLRLQAKLEIGVKAQFEAVRRAAGQGVLLSDQELQQVAQEAMNPPEEQEQRRPSRAASPVPLFGGEQGARCVLLAAGCVALLWSSRRLPCAGMHARW
jgi:hypothetical protein